MSAYQLKNSRRHASACMEILLIVGLCTASSFPCAGLAQDEPGFVLLRPRAPSQGPNSAAITEQAWNALREKRYDRVMALANECIRKFSPKAVRQQGSLLDFPKQQEAFKYSALNDVATCLFIKGRAYEEQRKFDSAKQVYTEILEQYGFAQCWDPQGWFWSVASAAMDQLECIELGINYGDYTSSTLTERAWNAFKKGRYREVDLYVKKCLELYQTEAASMQASLTWYPPTGHEWDYWALNDVATCLYISGRSLQMRGQNREAAKAYRRIVDEFSYGLCWDPRGWFWRVILGAKRQLAFCPQS